MTFSTWLPVKIKNCSSKSILNLHCAYPWESLGYLRSFPAYSNIIYFQHFECVHTAESQYERNQTKVLYYRVMELYRRALVLLVVISKICICFGNPRFVKVDNVSSVNLFTTVYVSVPSRKVWRKKVFSKVYRKLFVRVRPSGFVMSVGIDFWSGFLLMLSGDVESNPGPVTPISNPSQRG